MQGQHWQVFLFVFSVIAATFGWMNWDAATWSVKWVRRTSPLLAIAAVIVGYSLARVVA